MLFKTFKIKTIIGKWPVIVLSGITFSLFFCTPADTLKTISALQPKVVNAYGYSVPADSLALPEVIPAGKPRQVKVGRIPEFAEILNIVRFKDTKRNRVLTPVIREMGKEGVGIAGTVNLTGKPVYCKQPQIVLAKDAYTKDVNPGNFSSFSKLQGLRHDQIRSLIQDAMGNIWLGTDDGLTKYDGKYFSHFTTEQGLNSNLILSVFQDRKATIWFGTFGGGVTKYDGKYLTALTVSEGFLNNVVNCIFEDKEGNMWFGTGGGVAMYNGKVFTYFTTKEGLCHNDVRSILQDNSGKIWISTNGNGISVFDGKSFSNYSEKNGLLQKFIGNLFKDKSGNIWIGTVSNGIMKYDGLSFTIYSKAEGLQSNLIRSIVQDDDGNMWLGTYDKGISKFDGQYFTHYTEKEGLSVNIIRCSLKDRDGKLWFGTRGGGLSRFDGDLCTHLTVDDGLSNNKVFNILQDKKGSLWFATFGGGVTKCTSRIDDGIKQRYFSTLGGKEGLLNDRVYSLLEDKSGNIWFGSDGGGISKLDGRTTTTYTEKQGLCNNAVRKIYQDLHGDLWIATYGSGVSKFDGKSFTNYSKKQGLSSNNVLSILQDSKGNMWFGTDGGGASCFDGKRFIHYTKKQGFFNNIVYCILQDNDGTIWFGTGGDGLVKYDGKTFTSYAEDAGMSNNHVLSILQDSMKNIWAGTRFGLNMLKIDHLKKENSTQEKILVKSYGYEDGFIGIGCNIGSLLQDREGAIWIGTNDRLTVLKSGGDTKEPVFPNLRITKVQLFNENIPWSELAGNKDTTIVLSNGASVGRFRFDDISEWDGLPENLRLNYKQNFVTFNFIAIAHKQKKEIKYQYMLEGFDKNWSSPTDHTEASYSNLNPGSYNFRVKSTHNDKILTFEAGYPFMITPPWYKTWLFYVLSLLVVIVLIIGLIKYRERRLEHDKQLLQLKVKVQTQELTKKNSELQIINAEKDKFFSIISHDLRSPFNGFLGLTQIMAEDLQSLSMAEIQEIAKSMRNSVSNLFRLLENLLEWARIQQGLIPFNPRRVLLLPNIEESIQMAIEVSKHKGIEISCDIPEDLMVYADTNILQTILRNLLSNAVKYTHKGGRIKLSARINAGNCTEIAVGDSGIGMNPLMIDQLFRLDVQKNRQGTDGEPSTGLGLLLCKEFIEKHGGRLWVESEENSGSIFYFTMPYIDDPEYG